MSWLPEPVPSRPPSGAMHCPKKIDVTCMESRGTEWACGCGMCPKPKPRPSYTDPRADDYDPLRVLREASA